MVTHPDFPSQDLSFDDQAALAARGALLERCFTTPHTGKVSWERMFERGSRHRRGELGALDRSRPARQPDVEDGLGLMVDRLLAAGFDEEAVHTWRW